LSIVDIKQPISTHLLEQVQSSVGQVLLGKQEKIKLLLCALLSRGHILIEDLPGMGKTTLAQAIADVLGLNYNRVQFTSDLLPADLLGVSVFDKRDASFVFHPGPIFTQLLLADEINRSTPKTQSALLEAMEEQQVSIEGQTRSLAQTFFVIATQNPSFHSGTYPLPESQLDRFNMRIELGYPSAQAEREILKRLSVPAKRNRETREQLAPLLNEQQLEKLQLQASQVIVSEPLFDYIQRLIAYSRNEPSVPFGISPRGAIALLSAAKAWSILERRDYLLPEDIQAVFVAVIAHRISAVGSLAKQEALAEHILSQVDVIYG